MDVLWKDTNIFYNVLCFLITENEKLFDRNDARLYWKTVVHIFGILHHCYIGLFAVNINMKNHKDINIQTLYTFRAAYLTGWNFMFQTVFLCLSLAYDVLEWLDKEKDTIGNKIRYWRDVIFCGMVLPYSMFVTTMFWSLYWIDRELVFPKVLDEIVPSWFNHCVHTNICVVLLVETLLQPRREPTDKKLELILNAIVGISYAIVYYSIFFFAHRWLYNVFGILTWWQVVLYQIGIWTSSYVFYIIQFPINRMIHAEEKEDTAENAHECKSDSNTNHICNNAWSLKYRNITKHFENSKL